MTRRPPVRDVAGVLDVAPEVEEALAAGRGVVALESTLVAHGLPHPANLETVRAMEAAVREGGAVPATVAVWDGRLRVGLAAGELEALAAAGPAVEKLSTRDLPAAVARGGHGATTVAATMVAAARAGIRLFATGGIGGVHRDVGRALDVSADLLELSRTPVAVVCSGAKAILDLPRTLEVLESLAVPVIGYGTDEWPAFYTRGSGLALATRCDAPEEVARLLAVRWALGPAGGAVIANPVPVEAEADPELVERAIGDAVAEVRRQGVEGKGVTPFLLARVAEATGGAALAANRALAVSNARLAGRIAAAAAVESRR